MLASRTYEPIRPPTGAQVLSAGVFTGKLRLEFLQGFRKNRPPHSATLPVSVLLKQPDKHNSTSIATRLDPEEWRKIIANCRQAPQSNQSDVLAGWPEAHENDTEQAARAGPNYSRIEISRLRFIASNHSPSARVECAPQRKDRESQQADRP